MRLFIFVALLSCFAPPADAYEDIPLLSEGDTCRYLVPSVENGGDLLENTWRGVDLPANDDQWSDGLIGLGFDTGGQRPFYDLVIHDVSEEMHLKSASIFVRIPFELDARTIASIEQLTLEMRYDDGFVAWINGVEVTRRNAPEVGELTWLSDSPEPRPSNLVTQVRQYPISAAQVDLQVGTNYLTVHALNNSAGNQDFLMSPELIGSSEDTILFEKGDPCEVLVPSVANGGDLLGDTWQGADLPENYEQWWQSTLAVGFSSDFGDAFHEIFETDVLDQMRYQNASAFIRVPFEINNEEELERIRSLWLNMRYDDGFVVWLNGVEALRVNAPVELNWESSATRSRPDSQVVIPDGFDLSDHLDLLVVGANVMAIQGLNGSVGSADFLTAPELVGDSRPQWVFRDDANMTTQGVQYIPDFGGLQALEVTYGVATGRQYAFESSKDLATWKLEARFLAQPEDEFRRTLRARAGFGTSRIYCRLRELPQGE